jgi:hypothetical protein
MDFAKNHALLMITLHVNWLISSATPTKSANPYVLTVMTPLARLAASTVTLKDIAKLPAHLEMIILVY